MTHTDAKHLHRPVLTLARNEFATLREDFTVGQALDEIRSHGLGDRIVYFYVLGADDALVGVIPTRRLLTTPLDERLSKVMIGKVVTIPQNATVWESYELFVLHKFLAFPVVDEQRHIVGVVDIGIFTKDLFDAADRERVNEVFETIGFSIAQVRDASLFRAFRLRFVWLLSTIASGTICALLSSAYEVTITGSIALMFFLTLVLGLGESVSMQAMTMTIRALYSTPLTLRWYVQAFRREVCTSTLLGAACGLAVGLIALLWRGTGLTALAIGTGIFLAICAASFFGLSIPTLIHAKKLDPRIAAGPVTLAITDISTILVYFSIAALLL